MEGGILQGDSKHCKLFDKNSFRRSQGEISLKMDVAEVSMIYIVYVLVYIG